MKNSAALQAVQPSLCKAPVGDDWIHDPDGDGDRDAASSAAPWELTYVDIDSFQGDLLIPPTPVGPRTVPISPSSHSRLIPLSPHPLDLPVAPRYAGFHAGNGDSYQ